MDDKRGFIVEFAVILQFQKYYKLILEEVKNALDGIWIPEMIVSEQIVLNDELDLAQLQKGQHFALISESHRHRHLMFSKLIFGYL